VTTAHFLRSCIEDIFGGTQLMQKGHVAENCSVGSPGRSY